MIKKHKNENFSVENKLLNQKIKDIEGNFQETIEELRNIKYALDQASIVAITDRNGIIEYANDKFVEISKYKREELIGHTHQIINSGYHKKEFFRNLWKTIRSGRVWRGEIRNRAKDGTYYWVDTTITPLLDREGKPNKFIAIRTDITRRKELEQQKDDFINMASHELKTPVTSVKIFAQILQKMLERQKDKESIKYIGKMNRQLDKLTKLVRELLDISRSQIGKLEFNMEELDLNIVIEEVVEHMQLTTLKHKIIVNSSAKKKIVGDRDRLSQVFVNMLTNAIKFSPKGGNIIISTKEISDDILVSVRDFGFGIGKEHHHKIFDKFYQITNSEKKTYPGLGMGLYISSQIIKRHGGKLWVESERGKGSTFYFTLPFLFKQHKNYKNRVLN